jgi:phosphoglycolate phosphatase-like HAD superfamily hydrolase
MDYVSQLKSLPKRHDFFVGIDSDGCVFDSMEIKHKECFCPAFIKHFGLQAASKYAREIWDFVNLYSRDRGCNRFLAAQKSLKLAGEREVFAERGLNVVGIPSLDAWLKEETKLGNPTLAAKVKATNDPALAKILEWSKEVNTRIEEMVFGVPPFPWVVKSLEKIRAAADVIVVSQTPVEALVREWQEHKIDPLVNFIAGQEAGTKTEHIRYATTGRYTAEKILMIGDAHGDLKAAKGNGALFFPIVPGKEELSWKRFFEEGADRFFAGTFAGGYQEELSQEFDAALPEKAPWQK